MYTLSFFAALLSVASALPATGTGVTAMPTIGPCTDTIHPHGHIVASPGTTAVAGLQLTYDAIVLTLFDLLFLAGRATLTDSGIYSQWDFSNGGVGVKPDCGPTSIWLNIDAVAPAYKPLFWNSTQITKTWSGAYGQNLVALGTSTYTKSDTFLACKLPASSTTKTSPWYLFLVTNSLITLDSADSLKGFDTKSCVKTKLFIETPTYGVISP
ncbi:hypothetical protein FRB90_000298 [Tulasnella sp. 427]|nr:hypothetical protein FRB90_000298 [Tulasnella sp. 427]